MTKVTIAQTNIDQRVMPAAPELEEAVLGAIMLEHQCLETVKDILKPEIFYLPAHQLIYEAIQSLHREKRPVDILTVTNRVKENGDLLAVGGAYYISQLTNRVASSANVEYHSRVLLQKWSQRELIYVATETANQSFEDTNDSLDTLEKLKVSISEMEETLGLLVKQVDTQKKVDETFHSMMMESAQDLKDRSFTWGLSDLDAKCPLMRRLTYVEAGRPGMGKTSKVRKTIIANAIERDEVVVFFSLEMPIEQVIEDLASMITNINSERIRARDLSTHERERIGEVREKIRKNLIIDDTGGITYQYLMKKVQKVKKEQGDVGIVIVDYIQLMTLEKHEAKGKTRDQELSVICNALSNFAKNENFALIEISQLSREVEKRNPPRPILPDLRDSGAIEQNAVAVIFLYRPEYYGIFQDDNGYDVRGLCEINVAKFRLGSTGSVFVRFVAEYTLFLDYKRV